MHSERFEPPRRGGFQGYDMVETVAEPDLADTLDLSKYLKALRRHWLLLVVCVLIAVTIASIRYSLTTKEYMSTTTIQIERKRLSLYALGQGAWLEDWWNMEYYPTQYRLLRSRGMAERVVQNLRLYENPAFTGRPPISASDQSEIDSTSEIELAQLAGRIRGGLEVRPIKDTQLVELSFRSHSPELAAQIADGYAEAFIEWGIETRSTTVGRASSFLSDQIDTLNHEIEDRQKRLNALAGDTEFALDPAGEALLERQQTLQEQYNKVVAERIGKEAAYKGVLSLPQETVANTSSGGRVSQLKSELFLLEGEYKSQLGTYLPTWPEMKERKKEIDEKRSQLERLIQETYAETRDRAYAEYEKATREEESLERELRKMAKDARLQNSTILEYANLRTYIDTRKALRDDLLKRQSETEIASRTQTSSESNVRIVDRAVVPTSPFRPSLRNELSRALAIGIVLGVAGVFLIEFMDRTIKTPEEFESILGLPALAVVPDIDDSGRPAGLKRYMKSYGYSYGYGYGYGYGYSYGAGKAAARRGDRRRPKRRKGAGGAGERPEIELLPHKNPRLAVCESYRSLRTALLLSSAEKLQVVAVTSAQPTEGKTVTTCNLGVVLAQLERRVLIVDCDLRRPRMYKVFKVSNRLGLVNYLTSAVSVDQLVFETGVPDLYVCPSGPIPPNPSELLSSERMREFVTEMRSRFDFVLIDTPPVLPVTDTVILGPLADGLVLAGRAGYLQRDDAKLCRERLRYAEIKTLGLVLNRYRPSAGGYNRRYDYYGAYEESPPSETHSAA